MQLKLNATPLRRDAWTWTTGCNKVVLYIAKKGRECYGRCYAGCGNVVRVFLHGLCVGWLVSCSMIISFLSTVCRLDIRAVEFDSQ